MHHHCITASAIVAVCLAVVGVVVPHVAAFAPPPLLSSSSSSMRRSTPRVALAAESDNAAPAPPKKKNMGMTDAELIEIADSVDTRWVCPSYLNICEEEGVTLSRYMMEMVRANPELEEIQSSTSLLYRLFLLRWLSLLFCCLARSLQCLPCMGMFLISLTFIYLCCVSLLLAGFYHHQPPPYQFLPHYRSRVRR